MENTSILDDLAGDYEFLSEINSNENSRLFLLYDKLCSRKVLLKSGKADLIENEARLLSKVAGKGIPAVYGCLEFDGSHYILRQYIEGRNLRQCIEEDGLFTPEMAAELAASLCEIVSRLHRCDPAVIHRDIKPENIVLTSKGELYIIDFGISRQYDSTAIRDTCVMGTLSSAPPEQYGYGQTDERSDIYSIGVLLREIVGNENIESDKKLLKIVKKCTMFSPEDRYSSVSDIKRDLEELFFVAKHIKRKKFALTAAIFAFFMGLSTLFGIYLARPNPIKIASSMKSEPVFYFPMNDTYPGDYSLTRNIRKSILREFKGDIRIELDIEMHDDFPDAYFILMAYIGENNSRQNVAAEVEGECICTDTGFIYPESGSGKCTLILSRDVINTLGNDGICFRTVGITIKGVTLYPAEVE